VKINTEGFVLENGLMDFPETSFMVNSVLTVWPTEPNAISQEIIKTVKLLFPIDCWFDIRN